MKRKVFAIFCYCAAMGAAGLSLAAQFSQSFFLRPAGNLFLLCCCCLFLYLGSLLWCWGIPASSKAAIMKKTFACCFGLYLFFLADLLLFNFSFGRPGFSFQREDAYFSSSVNLIPFATIGMYLERLRQQTISPPIALTNLLGNVAAFSPFAFFLPLLFPKISSFKKFALSIIGIVSFAELLQLILGRGSCDIDDLILNAGGACILYGILHLPGTRKILRRITFLPD